MTTLAAPYSPGLKGVIAAQTRLSHIDGEHGELTIAGFALDTLAAHATFEEVLFALWYDRLPNAAELADLRAKLADQRALPASTLALLQAAADRAAPIIDMQRMGIGTLPATEDPAADAIRAVAAVPVIAAAGWRLMQGDQPIAPRTDLGHAANFLWMLTGSEPEPVYVRALDTYLIAVIDHGMNASTFTARVIASTGADVISAVTGAVGALKGPLHGGAPGPALDMVREIGTADRAEAYVRAKLESKEVIMGFGHRVYNVRDPRADALAIVAEPLFRDHPDADLYALALDVEQVVLRLLAKYKPGRAIFTNVEYYTALVLNGLGLGEELFTPTFAASRVGGWTAHCLEQIATGKIIRPSSAYTGEFGRAWVAIDER